MTYALHKYFVVDSFNHLSEFENWDFSDTDVRHFKLSPDSIIGRYSANYIHELNTNTGIVYREFNEATIDFDTNYTNLFAWVKSETNTLTHSGSEGFGMSDDDGTTVDYWYLDTTTADLWTMVKGTLALPDDDNGATLTAVDRILYTNNNSNSKLFIGFVCVSEEEFQFDTGTFISKPISFGFGQNVSKQKIPGGNNLIQLLGKQPRSFSLKIMLKGTTAWTDLNSLADIAKQDHPWLFEADWWFMPVTITNFSWVDKSTTQTANQDDRNKYEVTMTFKEHCGD